jgi:ferredoxin-NADP reductase
VSGGAPWRARLLARMRPVPGIAVLRLERPRGFAFRPGQSIRVVDGEAARDYSLASARDDGHLELVVRVVERTGMAARLASAAPGETVAFSGPHGFLVAPAAVPTGAPVLLAATGTGIAPFLSMARSGLRGSTLLHGVRDAGDLLWADEVAASGNEFVGCVSRPPVPPGCRAGRVTTWARDHLRPGLHGIWLCGNRDMVRDMTLLADELAPGCRVHAEVFF